MSNNKEKDEEKPIVAKTAVDLQRLKLMKLMKNPDKPIILPERPKPKNTPTVPEFVRNVMGSSAGAGSGEFHVYRHLRRKEYARQKFIQEKGYKELLDAEYHEKLEQNKKQAEEATAKKRAKRLKRKQKMKNRKKMKSTNAVKNNKKENMDMQQSDTDDSDTTEETNENRIQSNANDITPMGIEHLKKIENKEQMEVENNDKEYREINENSIQSDVIGDKAVMRYTTLTKVEQVKETEGKERSEEKEKTEAKDKESLKKSEIEHDEEDQKENEVEHEEESKGKNEVEREEENKGKSEIEHEEENKGKSEVEHEEESKGNDKANMVSNESMDKETKVDK